MTTVKQKTIKKKVTISGVGLHTGCQVELTLKPAEENTGVVFIRTDLPGAPRIKADPTNLVLDSGIPRCTSIGCDGIIIHTVEHFLSVLSGLQISNLIVEINEKELPGLDGSAIEYLRYVKKAGIVEQAEPLSFFEIKEPIGVQQDGSSIYIVPSKKYSVSYLLDYEHPLLKSQYCSFEINEKSFECEIAPCRTFCLESEAAYLREQGLGKGANFENTLVVGEKGVKDNELRFSDEFARHKILDFLGDLYLLGGPIRGQVFAFKSGHTLNLELLKKIWEQNERYAKKSVPVAFQYDGEKEINIDGIMKILPHRYPFLLVDRVIVLEKAKKAVGIKNVTINDHFFQGHFPTRPVMPGVLMVEAMAQTAGVVVLTNEAHRGKLAFFMAADNVKFRKVVSPGDQLLMEVEVVRDRAKTAQVRAQARVGDDIVAEADMVFSFTEASYLE